MDSMTSSQRLCLRAGFTLLELLIAMAVGLPVLVAVMALFRGQSEAYGRGEAHMEVARETALLTRVIFTELKAIHAPMTLDERYDLWVAGEADSRTLPNQVQLSRSGHELKYWHYPTDQPGERFEKRMGFDKRSLVLTGAREAKRIGRLLQDLRFDAVAGDPQALRVRFNLKAASRPGIAPASSAVDFTIRLEGALNAVR